MGWSTYGLFWALRYCLQLNGTCPYPYAFLYAHVCVVHSGLPDQPDRWGSTLHRTFGLHWRHSHLQPRLAEHHVRQCILGLLICRPAWHVSCFQCIFCCAGMQTRDIWFSNHSFWHNVLSSTFCFSFHFEVNIHAFSRLYLCAFVCLYIANWPGPDLHWGWLYVWRWSKFGQDLIYTGGGYMYVMVQVWPGPDLHWWWLYVCNGPSLARTWFTLGWLCVSVPNSLLGGYVSLCVYEVQVWPGLDLHWGGYVCVWSPSLARTWFILGWLYVSVPDLHLGGYVCVWNPSFARTWFTLVWLCVCMRSKFGQDLIYTGVAMCVCMRSKFGQDWIYTGVAMCVCMRSKFGQDLIYTRVAMCICMRSKFGQDLIFTEDGSMCVGGLSLARAWFTLGWLCVCVGGPSLARAWFTLGWLCVCVWGPSLARTWFSLRMALCV